MIKINLLGDDTVVDSSSKRIVAGYVASLLVLLVIFYSVHASFSSEIEELTGEIEQKEQELARLEKITKEVKDLEVKEAEYNNKINVIANLKKNKLGPVRILDDLNNAVPQQAWVTQIKEEGGLLRIDGKSIDDQTIAGFMRELEKSDYFNAIDLGETRQSDEKGAKIKIFSLNTTVSYSGSAKVEDANKQSQE
jgi:type IV pilus assembly protein PilN